MKNAVPYFKNKSCLNIGDYLKEIIQIWNNSKSAMAL